VAIALLRLVNADPALALLVALVVAVAVIAGEFRSARGKIRRGQQALAPMFPTPPDAPS
jgi:hypothetical protein